MLKYRLFLIVVLVTLLLVGCKAKETPTPATPEPTTETSIPTPTSWVQDVIAPAMVIDRSPEPGAELATDASIVLVFNQPMDRRAVESSFSIEPKVAGSFQWSDDQQLKFIPDKSLPRAGQYQVSLTSDATAATGAALRDYSFDFNTVGFLQVAQVSPPEGSSGVEPDSHIIVIFNRPVVPLATLNDQANFPHPLTLDPSIKGKGEWINTSIYEFVPDGNFPGGTRITASVPAGFKDLTGGILPEDHSWSFTTSPPVVTWHVPSVNAQQVPIADPISITFNQPVDLNSAREKIRVTDSSGTQVPGRITTDGAQVVFEQEGDLAFDEMYTVKIEPGLTSSSGGAGMEEEYSWHFNTVPLPRILSTDPRDGETRVHPQHRGFKIQFNTDIVPSTVMEHVSITPAITATEVSTWFSRWDDSFWIHFDFLPATEYQVKIEPGIKDAYGNETPDALDVTFTTRDYDPELRLITSGLVNTYDAYEPARLQVVYRNISGIDFKLYRLTADEYFKVEAEWERYTPAVGSLIREWSMPVERVPNSTEIVNINLLEDGGALEPGLYFLSSYSPEINNINYYWGYNHHLLVVTKTNLTLKWTEDQLLVWATDLQSGQPVSGLELKLITSGVERQTLFTDQDGVALLESVPRYKSELWVLSDEDGDRFSMASQWWDQGLSPWDFGFASGDYSMVERAHIYTDRPIYRPDQTVYYRGLVKMEDDARYHPLKQRQIQVTIKDPEYNDVFNELVTLNDNDAFSGELILAEDAPLGRYMIEITKDRYKSYGMSTFMVAAYRPPEFEVKVTPSMDEITVGESSKWATQVQTFFGSPVSDAELEWALIASPYSFDGPGNYSYDEVDDPWIMYRSWWGEPQAEKITIAGGKGRTDAQGMFLLDSPLDEIAEAVEKDGSLIVTFEVMVYGPDGSVISGRSQMVVHKGDYYVGVAASERIAQAGEPIQIDLITVEWPKAGQQLVNDGRLEGREITVELYRIEGESVYMRDEQGFGRWTWEQKEIFVEKLSAVTDDLGEASVKVTAPDAGSYRVKAISVDDSSRSIRSSTFFWAMGPGKVRWRIEDNNRVNLISNKDSYVPGEIAEILIPSPFEGPQTALVTIERADIKSYELIQMEGNTHVLHIPVTSDYAPNVYVSVVIAVEKNESNPRAEFRVGYTGFAVDTSAFELDVKLTPSLEVAQPRDTVQYELYVTDSSGEPVVGEFSFDVVDKAILSLLPRTDNQMFMAYYSPRMLEVRTSAGLVMLGNQQEDLEEALEMEVAGGMGGGGDGAMMDESAMFMSKALESADRALGEEDQVRQEFADTAFWDPRVITDENGKATVSVTLPDNLTTWTARAVGFTSDMSIGEGTVETVSRLPLMVRPIAPRFFVVDDHVMVSSLINNSTEEVLDIVAEIQIDGAALADDSPQQLELQIKPQSEEKVSWWIDIEDVKYVDLLFRARTTDGKYADASKPRLATGPDQTLPVYRYTSPEVVGTAGQLDSEGSIVEIVALPPRFDDRQGYLRVELDPSLSAAMRDGFDYLEHFEYECVEQTISRLLPNLLTLRALRMLDQEQPRLEARLASLVSIGLEKVVKMQNPDGGWGWWATKRSNPYVSSYAMFALAYAKEMDLDVPAHVIEKGVAYLRSQLVTAVELSDFHQANRQAWVLYVLDLHGSDISSEVDDLYRKRDKLSHYGRAYIAMTLGDDRRVDTLLSDLTNEVILSATGAHWEENERDWWAMNTDTRSTAIILDALTQLDPENQLIPNAIRWLMVARKGGVWETTQETAWALIAFTDWMAYTGELEGNYDWEVSLDRESWSNGTVTPDNIQDPIIMMRALGAMEQQAGGHPLVISRGEGEGRLYYSAHMRAYLPVEDVDAVNRGIIVQRQYVPADCEKITDCAPVDSAKVGEEIKVHLTIIVPNSLYYVVVEDPIPAGAEPIDTILDTTSVLEEGPQLRRQSEREVPWWGDWWWQWYSRSEMRDNKVVLFADYLAPGTYDYTYSFRATVPGEYRVIPAFANEFYFPEVFGRTDGSLFTITE